MSTPAALQREIKVPLLDLGSQFQAIRTEVLEAIREVCDSQRFILGPQVTALEQAVAAYSNVKHAIGVSSGTDALLVALMALDVADGAEVITTPYTFFATGGCVARAGGRPVFVDIEPRYFNIDPDRVEEFLESNCERDGNGTVNKKTGARVKALIPVHLYGQMADMARLRALAAKWQLAIIEDAAQAIGAETGDGTRAGNAGDIGCFSFFPSKNLGAFGDGGMCVTNDDALAESLRILRVHGGKPKYYHSVIGGNFRLDEIQAAVLNVKLKYLDGWTAGRQKNAAHYDELLAKTASTGAIETPARAPGRHIYNQYVIRAQRRDELRTFLQSKNIGTEIYYPVPLHLQKCFAYLGMQPGACPESERAARETLALPIYPELTIEQLTYVAEQIDAFYRRSG
jgi:dTDP-4-amino-4,6-dideoxygalactose transaminase